MSASTRASGFDAGSATPIMDTLHRHQNATRRVRPLGIDDLDGVAAGCPNRDRYPLIARATSQCYGSWPRFGRRALLALVIAGGHAAVDQQRRPGGERSLVACVEGRRGSNVAGLADPADRRDRPTRPPRGGLLPRRGPGAPPPPASAPPP